MNKPAAFDATSLQLIPKAKSGPLGPPAEYYRFRLYVAGETTNSLAAIANLRRLCGLHLPGRHSIEVIDLVKHPELAAKDEILAVPTLVRRLPAPIKRVIGSLADAERVIVALELGLETK